MNTTINLGIDLGTTNSVAAMFNGGTIEIVKNQNAETTPSFVHYDKRGSESVGAKAKKIFAHPDKGPDVHAEFKRLMGQDKLLNFGSANLSKTPEDLSALVLSDLRRSVEERYGNSPVAAVITVPAMFELPQNEATAKAAMLAGFTHSQLLQEPVAAAVAYGMEPSSDKSLWMIYDYGGGTFDTSLISIRDGALTVVKHAGDNYLGGADFDWAIVDEILLPSISSNFSIGNLQRHNSLDLKSVSRLRKLKLLAEEIKVELGRKEQYDLFIDAGELFKDDNENPIELEITILREQFEKIISQSVSKSVGITNSLIQDSGYSASNIERIVLVGGSTFVPLVREKIAELGIPLCLDLDPMTVVARGAAAFASTQEIPSSKQSMPVAVKAGIASINLEHEKITKNVTPLIGGKVSITDGPEPSECKISITRADNGFTSGNLNIDRSGVFYTPVQILASGQSVFKIELRDPNGQNIETSPSEFAITNGLSIGKATLPSGISVALADGSANLLIPSGTTLPNESTHELRTSRALKSGSNDELVISFLSGDEARSDHNLVSMQIKINGHKIKRDLPIGSTVEISIRVDESGVPHPVVYIERLDEEFEPEDNGRKTTLSHESPSVMRERLSFAKQRTANVTEKANKSSDQASTESEIKQIEDPDRIEKINKLITAWEGGDDNAAGRARSELVELAKDVDRIDTLVDWPAKVSEFNSDVTNAREVILETGQSDLSSTLDTIESEGNRAIEDHNPKMLDASLAAVSIVRIQALQQDPRFWAGMLQFCGEQISDFPDQIRAKQLLTEGAGAMRRGDANSLQSICRELVAQLPNDVANQAQGFAIRSDVH